MWKTALLVAILSPAALSAQSPAARIQISGRVSRMGSLSLAAAGREVVPLASNTANSRQVRVTLRPSASGRTISVPLIARSNVPYRLLMKCAQPLRVGIASAGPNAGTAHLTTDATSVRTIENRLSGEEVTLIEGQRISSGGTDATPDNALRLTVEVEGLLHLRDEDRAQLLLDDGTGRDYELKPDVV